MARVTDQDVTHALFPTLDEVVETRADYDAVRLRIRRRSRTPLSLALRAWQSTLADTVAAWRALSSTEKAWYQTNAPAYFKSGYTWYMSVKLIAASHRGDYQPPS